MNKGEAKDSSAKAGPLMVVINKGRHWRDLHSVLESKKKIIRLKNECQLLTLKTHRVICTVFKQTVIRIEQLSRQKKKKLSGWPTYKKK